jgi:HSP20 family molecular chaperone IbpA
MPHVPFFSNPLFLGFDELERLHDRAVKNGGDGYPPYNIEKLENGSLRIVLAVAGFGKDELEVLLEDNQLAIRGRQRENGERAYLHRGIAARHFARAFVLADGIDVKGASLENGLLSIELERPEPGRMIRRIDIEGA